MYDTYFKSIFYTDSYSDSIDHFVFDVIYIYNRHFLLYERADLTVSALLQRIRGENHSFIRCASHLRQPRLVINESNL